MTATIIPYTAFKARLTERAKDKLDAAYLKRVHRWMDDYRADTDCGEWPKWEDMT